MIGDDGSVMARAVESDADSGGEDEKTKAERELVEQVAQGWTTVYGAGRCTKCIHDGKRCKIHLESITCYSWFKS